MFWKQFKFFFTRSTKRVTALKDFIASKKVEDPLCLRNLSRIRWIARAESIKSSWNSFEAIPDCLDSLRSLWKTKTVAAALVMKMSNFDTIVFIMFMKNLMYKTKIKRMTGAHKQPTAIRTVRIQRSKQLLHLPKVLTLMPLQILNAIIVIDGLPKESTRIPKQRFR